MVRIRLATLEDVVGIAAVVEEVWEQTIDFTVYHSQISDDTGAIWVAAQLLKIREVAVPAGRSER